jgi:hypothetical protein
MLLARIEPDKPDHDKRTFVCSICDHSESFVVKYKKRRPAALLLSQQLRQLGEVSR